MRESRLGDGLSPCAPARPRRRILPPKPDPDLERAVLTWPAWTLMPVDQLNLDLFDGQGNHVTEVQHGTCFQG